MAKRTAFLLRIDSEVLAQVRHWADTELRSTNAQIEVLLRQALADAGRNLPLCQPDDAEPPPNDNDNDLV